jgi:pyridoxine 5-phosphate synthase
MFDLVRLSVNVDHVATVRQARRGDEPDPVRAAHEAEMGGADGITVHLREDRRHIQDDDVHRLRELTRTKFNLEMAATDEMVALAIELKPQTAMLVPEGREEVTTEGGLDVVGGFDRVKQVAAELRGKGILTSVFLDAEDDQIDAAGEAGVDVVEIHTGPYAHAWALVRGDFRHSPLRAELDEIAGAGERIRSLGMRFNAGHALNYYNVQPVAALPGVEELHIGHAIVSRAVLVGMREAVSQMKRLLREASAAGG